MLTIGHSKLWCNTAILPPTGFTDPAAWHNSFCLPLAIRHTPFGVSIARRNTMPEVVRSLITTPLIGALFPNAKHIHARSMWNVEKRPTGSYFSKSAYHGDKHDWRGLFLPR
jgi:hypothetical protein